MCYSSLHTMQSLFDTYRIYTRMLKYMALWSCVCFLIVINCGFTSSVSYHRCPTVVWDSVTDCLTNILLDEIQYMEGSIGIVDYCQKMESSFISLVRCLDTAAVNCGGNQAISLATNKLTGYYSKLEAYCGDILGYCQGDNYATASVAMVSAASELAFLYTLTSLNQTEVACYMLGRAITTARTALSQLPSNCQNDKGVIQAQVVLNSVEGTMNQRYQCNTDLLPGCPLNTFTCENGLCTTLNNLCNNVNDCGDLSDEVNCNSTVCLAKDKSLFLCHDSTQQQLCISMYKLCNGKQDCPDGFSDEISCTAGMDCPFMTQPCQNGQCRQANVFCDGKNDGCADEESVCMYSCGDMMFMCEVTGQCIYGAKVCDGVNDCTDLSDEALCNATLANQQNETCSEFTFVCSNKRCVSLKKVCDGFNNCGDKSDETIPCTRNNCSHTFMCTDGTCIQLTKRCDGKSDCTDGKDENECAQIKCGANLFTCSNFKCVSLAKICDGKNDCKDNSDEDNCGLGQLYYINDMSVKYTAIVRCPSPMVIMFEYADHGTFTCAANALTSANMLCSMKTNCTLKGSSVLPCYLQYPTGDFTYSCINSDQVLRICKDGLRRVPFLDFKYSFVYVMTDNYPTPPVTNQNCSVSFAKVQPYRLRPMYYQLGNLATSTCLSYVDMLNSSSATINHMCGQVIGGNNLISNTVFNGLGIKFIYNISGQPVSPYNGFLLKVEKNITCSTQAFRCANQKCISVTNRCDKKNDCGDNSDEIGCTIWTRPYIGTQ